MSQKDPIKVAVIGLGFWARFQISAWRALEKQGLVKLAAICGRHKERSREFIETYGLADVKFYSDADELINDGEDFDLLDIITQTDTHYDWTMKALRKGIPTIIQKPMASTLNQVVDMVMEAERLNVPFMVHEDFRWQTPIRKVKELYQEHSKELGGIRDVEILFISGGEDFLRGQPYLAEYEFFFNGELGPHMVDLMRYVTGSNVLSVLSAQMQTIDKRHKGEDFARVSVQMENGITGIYATGATVMRKNEAPPNTFINLTCEQGCIQLDKDFEITLIYRDGRKDDGNFKLAKKVISAAPEKAPWALAKNLNDYIGWVAAWESNLPTNESFVRYLRGETEENNVNCVTTGADNLNVMTTVFAAYLASRKRSSIPIPKKPEDMKDLADTLDQELIGYPEHPSRSQT